MNDSGKQVIVSVVIAVAVLWLYSFIRKEKETVTPTGNKKYQKPDVDPATLEEDAQVMDAYAALCAYIDAYNDGKDATFLADLNSEFKKEMGVCVYENSDGSISVEDLSGKEILLSKQMS